jgi:hypothetical protein
MRTLLATLLFCAAVSAEVIDRVAVTVANSVITETEILRQIRITALLNGEQPDLSVNGRRQMAERLVEQTIIRRELNVTRYTGADPARKLPAYDQFKAKFGSPEAYQKAVAEYGIEDRDVRENFEWQSTLLEFVDARFRPGIQLADSELREYYEQTLLPQIDKNEPKPTFDSVREKIEEILTLERVDNALDRWLGQMRTQTRIQYREEAFS